MGKNKSAQVPLSEAEIRKALTKQACESCRRRKLKCTKQTPKCEKCKIHNWSCCYIPKLERTPLTRKQLTEMEIRCWKLDQLVQKIINEKYPKSTVDGLLKTIPEPTDEDFIKMNEVTSDSNGKTKTLIHDGKTITLKPGERILEYLSDLNIPSTSNSINIYVSSASSESNSNSKNKILKNKSSKTSINSKNSIEKIEIKDEKVDDNDTKVEKESNCKSKISENDALTDDIRPKLSTVILDDPLYGLDWKESTEIKLPSNEQNPKSNSLDISDGMAALNLNPEGKGYFGIASSAETVRQLNMHHDDFKNNLEIPVLPNIKVDEDFLLVHSEDFVNAYFKFYHSSYPFIHKKTFLNHFLNPKTLEENQVESFEILKLTVCSIGCWCMSHKDSDIDLQIYRLTREKLGKYVFEHGNIFITLALILLSNYIQKRDFPNTGWAYLGLAVRHALGIALHENIKGASPLEQEIRNRIWWGLYIFDVGTAITWGRPVQLPNPDEIRINCIKNIPDEIWDDENISSDKLVERNYPTIYSGFIAQIKFTHISSAIYKRTLSTKKLSLSECILLNKDIEDFKNSLPDYLSFDNKTFNNSIKEYFDTKIEKPPNWLYLTRFRLFWRVKNLQNVLFKSVILYKKGPLFLRQDPPEVFESITLTLDSSNATIESVSEFFHKYYKVDRLATWYAVYFSFQAVVIPMFCLLKEPKSRFANQWLEQLTRLRMVLLECAHLSFIAEKFVVLIDKAIDKYNELTNDFPLPPSCQQKRKFSADNLQNDDHNITKNIRNNHMGTFMDGFGFINEYPQNNFNIVNNDKSATFLPTNIPSLPLLPPTNNFNNNNEFLMPPPSSINHTFGIPKPHIQTPTLPPIKHLRSEPIYQQVQPPKLHHFQIPSLPNNVQFHPPFNENPKPIRSQSISHPPNDSFYNNNVNMVFDDKNKLDRPTSMPYETNQMVDYITSQNDLIPPQQQLFPSSSSSSNSTIITDPQLSMIEPPLNGSNNSNTGVFNALHGMFSGENMNFQDYSYALTVREVYETEFQYDNIKANHSNLNNLKTINKNDKKI